MQHNFQAADWHRRMMESDSPGDLIDEMNADSVSFDEGMNEKMEYEATNTFADGSVLETRITPAGAIYMARVKKE